MENHTDTHEHNNYSVRKTKISIVDVARQKISYKVNGCRKEKKKAQ